MATELRIRGGTTAQHASFTGATKEITVDTTKNTVVVHDGSTAGGVPLATENNLTSEINSSVHAPGTGLPNEIQTYFNNTLTSTSTEQALTAAQGKVLQDSTVKLTGDQTIEGVKTFSSSPVVPTPVSGTNNTQVATTAFVQNAVGSISVSPTTAQVLSATAGALVGAVGTYAFLGTTNTSSYGPGATIAGSNLRYAAVHRTNPTVTNTSWASTLNVNLTSRFTSIPSAPAGTWMSMGNANYSSTSENAYRPATLWLRIS